MIFRSSIWCIPSVWNMELNILNFRAGWLAFNVYWHCVLIFLINAYWLIFKSCWKYCDCKLKYFLLIHSDVYWSLSRKWKFCITITSVIFSDSNYLHICLLVKISVGDYSQSVPPPSSYGQSSAPSSYGQPTPVPSYGQPPSSGYAQSSSAPSTGSYDQGRLLLL